MPPPITLTIDPEEFRRQLERTATVLLHDVRRCPSEETALRAGGGLDGLVRGIAALAQSAGRLSGVCGRNWPRCRAGNHNSHEFRFF
jgi:hypothetical protein